MPWTRITPQNQGGGRQPIKIACRLHPNGQFSMTHAVADMLGNPSRVIVEINPQEGMIRLTPTTPENQGAYALSGGGNASHRITMREATKHQSLIGEYTPKKQAGSVLFTRKAGEDDRDIEL